MRLIDADALSNHKFLSPAYMTRANSKSLTAMYQQGWNDAIDAIIESEPAIITARTTTEGFPIIDMRPRNTGEWITTERGYVCSVCGALHVDDYPFCHMCGADMRVKDELNNELNELGGRHG